jgi:hypothetical protein
MRQNPKKYQDNVLSISLVAIRMMKVVVPFAIRERFALIVRRSTQKIITRRLLGYRPLKSKISRKP